MKTFISLPSNMKPVMFQSQMEWSVRCGFRHQIKLAFISQFKSIVYCWLQLQIQIQTQNPQDSNGSVIKDEDHIDAALNELQMVLEGTSTPSSNCGDILQIPELCDYLRFYK